MEKEYLSWKVSSAQKGMRLLLFLQEKLASESFSNKQLKRALDRGAVRVNGVVECFSSYLLRGNEEVFLWKDWQTLDESSTLSLTTLYEDPYLWLFDKPSGLEVTSEIFAPFFSQPFYLVHRLDKGTSGVIIVAKSETVESKLKDLFQRQQVKKKYLAIVDGKVDKPQGFIQNKLAKKRAIQGQTLWGVTPGEGLLSSTHWSLVKTQKNISLLLCRPLTGRTHQIRVHLHSIGHPILGDYLYVKKFSYTSFVPRLLLHSYEISFPHPMTQKKVTAMSPIPPIFETIIGPIDHV